MKIFNTLTRKKEEFIPIDGSKVNFFVCGPTVYDYAHIGHAKTYTQFDFIVKYLRYKGYRVDYLQNITDIDDKIIARARERGVEWKILAEEYEEYFKEDMMSLHNDAVTTFARATDYINQIVRQVKILINKGFAYQISDGIYFEVSKFKDYGQLSGRKELQENDAVSRIDQNEEKRAWNDFCLWKFSKEEEPFWDTEIGKGRPGWHIEDTAITETFFGPQYDIHGGAVDLIFPHHEAEISQMEAVSGKKPLVKYWMHTAFLNINSEKMSKSKGNFKIIRDLLANYDYRILRYFFLSSHYRSTIDFSETLVEGASNSLKRIQEFIYRIDRDFIDDNEKIRVEELKGKVESYLDDDFDSPRAVAELFEFIRKQNSLGKSGKYVYDFFIRINAFFDFLNFDEEEIPEEIKRLAEARNEAKRKKDWSEADRLRDEIKKMGYILEDKKDDCKIKKIMLS